MAIQEIDVSEQIAASAGELWRRLDDSSSWPDWTPIDSYERIEPPGGDGLGEVRRFENGRVTVTERIVTREPEQRLAYTLLSGLAVRDYRAEIELSEAASGTRIRWHTTFRSKLPGLGFLYRSAIERSTREFVAGLKAAVESDSQSFSDRS